MSGESSLETNCQLDISIGLFSVLYNSSHSSVAEASVPAQAISLMTTLPDFFAVDVIGVVDGFGVGTGVFDGDGVGDTMVTLVTGVFVTNGVGDTRWFLPFVVGVPPLSQLTSDGVRPASSVSVRSILTL